MKRAILITSLLLCAVGCGKNYSSGDRIGIITKLSESGLIFKSWDGTMLVALPVGVADNTPPEYFYFSVDPSCVEKVKAAMASGQRVDLVYRQWAIMPPTVDNTYVVIDVK